MRPWDVHQQADMRTTCLLFRHVLFLVQHIVPAYAVLIYQRLAARPLSLSSVDWAEDPNEQRSLLAGAIYLFDYSSIQVDGSISLVNNIAGDDGGTKH